MNDLPTNPMTDAIDQGLQHEADAGAKLREAADVKAWLKKINDARVFDEVARKRYAMDRRYARGDSGQFDIDVPIAGTYIDILKAFLYARDPDLDIVPSEGTSTPPLEALLEQARETVMADPAAQQAAQQAGMQAAQQAALAPLPIPMEDAPAMPPVDPQQAGMQAAQASIEQAIKAEADAMRKPYQKRRDDAKQLGQTLETIVGYLWRKAKLKAHADFVVGSGLTVAVGWLKASWQERLGQDPVIHQQINDLQDNIARLAADQSTLAKGDAPDADALKASIEQQIAGLQAQVEVVVARGLAMDFIAAEDIQVAPSVGAMTQYLESPWIAHRTFMSVDEAKTAFPSLGDKLKNASMFHQVKPADPQEARDVGAAATTIGADEADSYKAGSSATMTDGNVCVWEVWNRDANMVLTLIEGLDCYGKAPYVPNPGTTRFYPFFQWSPVKVDGERHPKSLIARTSKLLDAMNRIYSRHDEHQRRCLPKVAFDSTNLSPDEAKKLESGGIGEMIGIKPLRSGDPVGNMLQPIAYPPIDAAVYDDSRIRSALEMGWGIQEALSSTIRTAKTLGEAEIQQSGTEARTSYMRDTLDAMLSDLAQYTAEIAVQKLTREDAVRIAGPWALWPDGITVADLDVLVTVDIRAGSTGKPNTTAQRESWAATLPILQNAIMQIGQLRGSSPDDIANSIEQLVTETLERSGDRLDAGRFLPGAPASGALPMSPAMPAPAPQPIVT